MKKFFNNNIYYSTNLELEKNDVEIKHIDYSKKVFIALNKSKNDKLMTSISISCSDEDLKKIAKDIKTKCSSGGTIKDGSILIQGDFREKIYNIIKNMGFNNIKK